MVRVDAHKRGKKGGKKKNGGLKYSVWGTPNDAGEGVGRGRQDVSQSPPYQNQLGLAKPINEKTQVENPHRGLLNASLLDRWFSTELGWAKLFRKESLPFRLSLPRQTTSDVIYTAF